PRLAPLPAEAVAEALDEIAVGRAHWTPQDAARATVAPQLGPEDVRLDPAPPAGGVARRARGTAQDAGRAAVAPRPGPEGVRLDPALPAGELARRVRALSPRPGAALSLGAEKLRTPPASPQPAAA